MKTYLIYITSTGKICSQIELGGDPPGLPPEVSFLEIPEPLENIDLFMVDVGEVVPTTLPIPNIAWDAAMQKVHFRLSNSDWSQIGDTPANGYAWAVYRSQLRAIPSLYSTPESIVWPVEPSTTISDKINFERSRRIVQGVAVSVAGYPNTIHLRGLPSDIQTIQGLLSRAKIRVDSNDTTTNVFRDMNNVDHALTPAQMVDLGVQAIDWVEQVFIDSWALKAMDPIPEDYTNDIYWP